MPGEPDDQPTTEELRVVQLDRLQDERSKAEQADDDAAAERAHGRRADRAAYLAEKLEEQGKAYEE